MKKLRFQYYLCPEYIVYDMEWIQIEKSESISHKKAVISSHHKTQHWQIILLPRCHQWSFDLLVLRKNYFFFRWNFIKIFYMKTISSDQWQCIFPWYIIYFSYLFNFLYISSCPLIYIFSRLILYIILYIVAWWPYKTLKLIPARNHHQPPLIFFIIIDW